MRTSEYCYEKTSTSDLVAILEKGIDIDLFEPAERFAHVELAAKELCRRPNEPAAIAALCQALRCCCALRENPTEGIYESSETRLQLVLAGMFLRELKDVKSTVALLHAASTHPCEEVRNQANKAIMRRPPKVFGEAFREFIREFSYEVAQATQQMIVRRFSPPTSA